MFWTLIFFSTRMMQLVTLIPTLGMLAWFVGQYRTRGLLTPDYILVLFIVSVLGAAWAVATMIKYGATKRSGKFMAFIEFLFSMTLIAAVYQLRFITKLSCKKDDSTLTDGRVAIEFSKTCAMLKASFAFGIMNIVFFFTNSIVMYFLGRKHESKKSNRRSRSRSRRHRESHGRDRRHSHSRPPSRPPSRSRSRSRTRPYV